MQMFVVYVYVYLQGCSAGYSPRLSFHSIMNLCTSVPRDILLLELVGARLLDYGNIHNADHKIVVDVVKLQQCH